jgi:acyl-CoA hydrolase
MKINSEIVRYSQLVMPQDANVIGTLFGGQMISWMDIAVSKAAHRILKNSPADAAVTRAIDATEFKEPVLVGEWVNFEAVVTSLGKSSIKILVKAYAEGRHGEKRLACLSDFTMVAVKEQDDGSYTKCMHGQTLST